MLTELKCPNCGATLKVDDTNETFYCSYCGSKLINLKEQIHVTHKFDRENEPNLYISFYSNNPEVGLVSRLVGTENKHYYLSGQTMSFHLPKGKHEIVLKIGKKNNNRIFVIPEDNSPVRITCSYNGSGHISIDQPYYDSEKVVEHNVGKDIPSNALSIWAFILSFTGFLSIFGIGMAILDLNNKKNDPSRPRKLSIAAIIIGAVFFLVFVVNVINGEITFSK